MNIERRVFHADSLEFREDEDGTGKIIGHAAVFNTPTEIMGFREVVAPGAFKNHTTNDVRALINHDPSLILGRNKSGTLELAEDEKGLAVKIDPPDTSYARDLAVSLKRGDIDEMSFAFRVVKEEWEEGRDGAPDTRTLKEVDLFDVSAVTYPAYPDTDVAQRQHKEVRSMWQETRAEREAEIKRAAEARERALVLLGVEKRGDSLAAALNRIIDAKAGDDEAMRTDVLEDMVSAAGISVSTVNQILRGEINCPPLRRLQGFARALSVSIGRLTGAAEGDGCDYGG